MADRGKDHNPKGKIEGKNKGGAKRNGRKSPFKNHNPHGEETSSEYISGEDL